MRFLSTCVRWSMAAICGGLLSTTALAGDPLSRYPTRQAEPVRIGTSVANALIDTWPHLDDTTCGVRCFSLNYATVPATPAPKYWEYTNGVPLYGLWKLYERTGDRRYFDYVKAWVDRYIDADGHIDYSAGSIRRDPRILDTIQPGVLLFGLYQQTGEARYLTAMVHLRDTLDTVQKNPQGAFWHKPTYPDQQWLDGIYMFAPFLAKYAARHADQIAPGDASNAFDLVTEQIKKADAATLDPRTGLYFHAWNGAADGVWRGLKTPPLNGQTVSPILWSRSLAWYYTGIIDVLDDLPRDHRDRHQLLRIVQDISAGLARHQDRATGLWNQVIDVRNGQLPANGGYPNESVAAVPNWNETSASALFVYGLAKAVRKGHLPRKYLQVAASGWKGVRSRVDLDDGTITVRGTVVGMSVGGTYNAYANADFRSDLETGPLPAPVESCPTPPAFRSPAVECRTLYVRDNVPQGLGAVMLAASEMEN